MPNLKQGQIKQVVSVLRKQAKDLAACCAVLEMALNGDNTRHIHDKLGELASLGKAVNNSLRRLFAPAPVAGMEQAADPNTSILIVPKRDSGNDGGQGGAA